MNIHDLTVFFSFLVMQKLKCYLNKCGMVVDKDSNVVLQPAITYKSSPLLLVLLLTLITDVP